MISSFRYNWVLVNELAIGPAPQTTQHLEILKNDGIVSILSLCSEEEKKTPTEMEESFSCLRIVLPDHRSGRMPTFEEINKVLNELQKIKSKGPLFVHCVAAMERSPLICMAWLVKFHNLTPLESLDYLMQVHPGTNPLPGQLELLKMIN